MYGFRKISHRETGVLETHSSTELWEFQHAHFVRGRSELLPLVQRKKSQIACTEPPSNSSVDHTGLVASSTTTTTSSHPSIASSSSSIDPTQGRDYQAILSGINSIRSQQDAISQELRALRTNNAQLWTEALASKERHGRQQETSERILSFLAEVFGDGLTGYFAGSGGQAGGSGLRDVVMGRNEWERRVDDRWPSKIEDGKVSMGGGSGPKSDGLENVGSLPVDWGNEEMEEISSIPFRSLPPARYHYSCHSLTPERTPLSTDTPSGPPPPPSIRSSSSSSVQTLLTPFDDQFGVPSSFGLPTPSSATTFTPLSPFKELELALSLDDPPLAASPSNHLSNGTETHTPSLSSNSTYDSSINLDPSVVLTEDLLSSLLGLDGSASVDPPPCDPRLYESAQGIEANFDTMQSSISSLISSFGLSSARAAQLEGGREVENDDLDLALFGRVVPSLDDRGGSGETERGRKRAVDEDLVDDGALKEDLERVDGERKRARMGEV